MAALRGSSSFSHDPAVCSRAGSANTASGQPNRVCLSRSSSGLPQQGQAPTGAASLNVTRSSSTIAVPNFNVPPAARHDAEMDDELLRLQVYRIFGWTGRARSAVELADALDVTSSDAGLGRLAEERHVVLDPAGAIVMAHPFTAVPMGFSVMGDHTLWWGGCAWDSFALPQLLGDVVPGSSRVLVATTCPACGSPHAWNVDAAAPPEGDQVAHFLVPAAHIWDDVVHTCSNQRIFCSTSCVDDADRPPARLCHGPGHALAAGCPLVRREVRVRLPAARPRDRRRLPAQRRTRGPVLGTVNPPRTGDRTTTPDPEAGRPASAVGLAPPTLSMTGADLDADEYG
jgi:hypothetical protein